MAYEWWQYPGSNNAGLGTNSGGSSMGITDYGSTTGAPAATSTPQSGGGSSWLNNNWAQLAQLGLGAYMASQKPKYHATPLTDEEKKLYQMYLQQVNNPATKYNPGIASDIAKDQIARMGPTLPWNRGGGMPNTYQGTTPPAGFNPSGQPAMPADYLANLIKQSTNTQQKYFGDVGPDGGSPVPPPPPPKGGGNHDRKHVAQGVLGGLVGGAVKGGGWGGVLGAVTGGLAARKSNQQAWDESWKPWNDWKAQYGSAFTDASGKPMKVETLDDYKKWYKAKYGVDYKG